MSEFKYIMNRVNSLEKEIKDLKLVLVNQQVSINKQQNYLNEVSMKVQDLEK